MKSRTIILSIFSFLILASIVGSASEDVLCSKCHNDLGGISPHNGTVTCERCHGSSDIHTGVQYIQPDGSFGDRSTSATCVDCHSIGVFGFAAPMIPTLKHAYKINNGSVWGSYWSSESGSCEYCHGDTKHSAIGLGAINDIINDPTNMRNGNIEITTWCIDCHYNNTVNSYYKGFIWNPVPPLVNVKNTDSNKWVDHNDYLSNGYGDIVCRQCHQMSGSYPETSTNYVHSIGEAFGNDCTNCHGANY